MNPTTNTNTNSDTFTDRLKFYADTPMERNKYFCWEITSPLALKERLWYFFDKGWNIRSAWYEQINKDTGEIMENTRLNLKELMDEYLAEKLDGIKKSDKDIVNEMIDKKLHP